MNCHGSAPNHHLEWLLSSSGNTLKPKGRHIDDRSFRHWLHQRLSVTRRLSVWRPFSFNAWNLCMISKSYDGPSLFRHQCVRDFLIEFNTVASNEHHSSIPWEIDCLFNRMFRITAKNHLHKLHVTGHLWAFPCHKWECFSFAHNKSNFIRSAIAYGYGYILHVCNS